MTEQQPQRESEYTFGYFPRNKYKDLVFYVNGYQGKWCLNYRLFEMPDTQENRVLMEILSRPHTSTPACPELSPIQTENGSTEWFCNKEQIAHAATLAENTRVLKGITDWLRFDHGMVSTDALRERIESLRNTAGEDKR
jgi:hypothetical protein